MIILTQKMDKSLHLKVLKLALLLFVFETTLCGDYCRDSNFMTFDSIRKKSPFCFNDIPDKVKPVTKGLYLMPEMNFTCSGVIKSLLVGAKITKSMANSQPDPELQIWRKTPTNSHDDDDHDEDDHYEEAHDSVTLVSSHAIDIPDNYFSSSVYAYYNFHEPIEFSDGDFIGFYQPSNETDIVMFYTAETFMPSQTTLVDHSAIADDLKANVSLSLDSLQTLDEHYLLFRPHTNVGGSCLRGFLDYGEVKTKAKFITSLKYNNRELRLFPDIKFDCPVGQGFITGIKFGAQIRDGPDNVLLPELQIWRVVENSYRKIHSIFLIKNESRVRGNVHEMYFNGPIQFQDQDFIGLFQPEVDNSQLVVFYQESNGPKNLVLANDIDQPLPTAVAGLNSTGENDYPLVTVEIVQFLPVESTRSSSTTNDVYVTATVTDILPSSTQSNVPSTSGTDNFIVLIAIVIGVAVLLLLIVIVAIVTAIMCIKVKHQKQQTNNGSPDSTTTTASGAVTPCETKQLETRKANGLTMSHAYEECVQMEQNFSYGVVSPKELKMSTNPSYGNQPSNNHRESYISLDDSYEDYAEEYILPLPMEDETTSHQYY